MSLGQNQKYNTSNLELAKSKNTGTSMAWHVHLQVVTKFSPHVSRLVEGVAKDVTKILRKQNN